MFVVCVYDINENCTNPRLADTRENAEKIAAQALWLNIAKWMHPGKPPMVAYLKDGNYKAALDCFHEAQNDVEICIYEDREIETDVQPPDVSENLGSLENLIEASQAKIGDVIEMVEDGHLSGRYYRISKPAPIIGRIAAWDATATKVKVHHTCKCVVVPPHEVLDHLKKVWGMNDA